MTDPTCMHLCPNGPGAWHWCDLPADPRSDPSTPRCPDHLTHDTMRKEN